MRGSRFALLTVTALLGACAAKPASTAPAPTPTPPAASTAQPTPAATSGRWSDGAADAGFEQEPRDDAWAVVTEAQVRREFAAMRDPRMEATCVPTGRCRIRIRAQGPESEIAAALRLPGCKLDEAADEENATTYLLDCLPENGQWAERTQAELTRRFEAWRAQITLRLDSVECRSSRCRVLVTFTNPADVQRLRGEYDTDYLPIMKHYGGTRSGIEPTSDGFGMTIVIARDNGGSWSTQKSAYEYQVARDQILVRLREEPRDAHWAAKTELALKAHYEERLGQSSVKSVECRSTRCAVTFSGEEDGSPKRLRILDGCVVDSSHGGLDPALGKVHTHTLDCRRSR